MQTVLRIHEVLTRTTLSRAMIYKLMAREEFPQQINLGGRAVAWRESDIDAWIEARPSVQHASNGEVR